MQKFESFLLLNGRKIERWLPDFAQEVEQKLLSERFTELAWQVKIKSVYSMKLEQEEAAYIVLVCVLCLRNVAGYCHQITVCCSSVCNNLLDPWVTGSPLHQVGQECWSLLFHSLSALLGSLAHNHEVRSI